MRLSKTKYLQFPRQFDVEKLASDLRIAESFSWKSHYVSDNYNGNWSLIALISPGGAINNTVALANTAEEPAPTPILEACTYFQEVISGFDFPIVSARLMKLSAGSSIKPHTDHCLGYEDGSFRLHIPIVTNPELEFILGGERLIMQEGTIWYINANYVHSVANKGTTDRVHLVLDGLRNGASDEMFYALANPKDLETPPETFSEEEQALINEQLQRMGFGSLDAIS